MTMGERETEEARELAIEKEHKGPAVTEMMFNNYQYATKPGRSDSHNIGVVAVNILIVFAALAHAWDGQPAASFSSQALLGAGSGEMSELKELESCNYRT